MSSSEPTDFQGPIGPPNILGPTGPGPTYQEGRGITGPPGQPSLGPCKRLPQPNFQQIYFQYDRHLCCIFLPNDIALEGLTLHKQQNGVAYVNPYGNQYLLTFQTLRNHELKEGYQSCADFLGVENPHITTRFWNQNTYESSGDTLFLSRMYDVQFEFQLFQENPGQVWCGESIGPFVEFICHNYFL
jgi:hypothetical protein